MTGRVKSTIIHYEITFIDEEKNYHIAYGVQTAFESEIRFFERGDDACIKIVQTHQLKQILLWDSGQKTMGGISARILK